MSPNTYFPAQPVHTFAMETVMDVLAGYALNEKTMLSKTRVFQLSN